MKQITAEDVRKLREETGEGMMACNKILLERAAEEEKQEMLNVLDDLRYNVNCGRTNVDEALDHIHKLLDYLVRKA